MSHAVRPRVAPGTIEVRGGRVGVVRNQAIAIAFLHLASVIVLAGICAQE